MERRLAAIMAADMAGYSRLMEADEEGVLARQKGHRRELIDPEIDAANGRIVKSTGDGLLVEFGNAVDAVQCAVSIQSAMPKREAALPPDDRILYRVGINLGDILFEDDDVFGDAVNVAARLEGLSEPGGVCLSDVVHQLVGDRVAVPFRDLGSQRVKNISRPVRVWQWTPNEPIEEETLDRAALNQQVMFWTATDGVQIACSSVGGARRCSRRRTGSITSSINGAAQSGAPSFASLPGTTSSCVSTSGAMAFPIGMSRRSPKTR